ncbi:hypothetical protein [Bradyrhizobium tunisiense]|uniref:hypothetical protein n=1 Tax=Bradyrhizobium tunisiense TaxID=3278709 RepID=UPI0035D84498
MSNVPSSIPSECEKFQLELPLWNKRDPNLHAVGIHEFSMDGASLQRIVKSVSLPRLEGRQVIFELSDKFLTAHAETRDGALHLSARAPLSGSCSMGPSTICFEIAMETARKAAEAFQGSLHFRLAESESILWARTNDETTVAIAAKLHERPPARAVLTTLAEAPAHVLRTALQTAGVYHACKDPSTGLKRDLLIRDGVAWHGYLYAAARYSSVSLPFDLNIPGLHILNLTAMLSRCSGRVTIGELGDRFFLQSDDAVVACWSKNLLTSSACPRFDHPDSISVTVRTDWLQPRISLFAALVDQVQFTHLGGDQGEMVLMSGSFAGNTIKSWHRLPEATAEFNCIVRSRDLMRACFLFESQQLKLTFSHRCMKVDGVGSDLDASVILFNVAVP